MSELTPRLALPLIAASQAQKHVPVNEALTRLDALVQLSVLDRTRATAPALPQPGDRHIVGASPSGLWTGHSGDIAAYDAGWIFIEPAEGWFAWDAAEQELLVFTGGAWQVFSAGEGGGSGGEGNGGDPTELQNIELFGLGAEADTVNPFSAKLNTALWTAKERANGGSGDLRYVISKETGPDVLSILLQSGYSGRAEFGLIGDDNLLFKVSTDGVVWRDAIRIDNATGTVRFPQGGAREQLALDRTYYVSTAGSDANDGLSAQAPFATLARARDVILTLDLNGRNVTIQHAGSQSPTSGLSWSAPPVGGTVVLDLGGSTLNVTGGNCVSVQCPMNLVVQNGTLRVTSSGVCILAAGAGSSVTLGASLTFGPSAGGVHIWALSGGYIRNSGHSYTISGGAAFHYSSQLGAIIEFSSVSVTLVGAPSFSTFTDVLAGYVSLYAHTFSGAATGKRHDIRLNGVVTNTGGGANFFPGNSAGTTTAGGQFA